MSEGNHTYAEIARFIRFADRRGLYFGGWPDPVLEVFLQWNDENGDLVIKSVEGNLVAVAIVETVPEVDHDQHRGRGSINQQDPVEEEEWGVEEDVSGFDHVCHQGLTVFALESVFNKVMEGVK